MDEPFSVPIVGEPVTILAIYPVVIMNCKCRMPALNMIILSGIMNYVGCGHCKKLYAVEKFVPTPTGAADVIINVVLPTPTGSIQ